MAHDVCVSRVVDSPHPHARVSRVPPRSLLRSSLLPGSWRCELLKWALWRAGGGGGVRGDMRLHVVSNPRQLALRTTSPLTQFRANALWEACSACRRRLERLDAGEAARAAAARVEMRETPRAAATEASCAPGNRG